MYCMHLVKPPGVRNGTQGTIISHARKQGISKNTQRKTGCMPGSGFKTACFFMEFKQKISNLDFIVAIQPRFLLPMLTAVIPKIKTAPRSGAVSIFSLLHHSISVYFYPHAYGRSSFRCLFSLPLIFHINPHCVGRTTRVLNTFLQAYCHLHGAACLLFLY